MCITEIRYGLIAELSLSFKSTMPMWLEQGVHVLWR